MNRLISELYEYLGRLRGVVTKYNSRGVIFMGGWREKKIRRKKFES
jgi:hypothetical protein